MKKALLVAINSYSNRNVNLRGCVNDISQMSLTLTRYFGFDVKNIKMLIDVHATKANIVAGLQWLVADAQSGDSLIFHYSGHGSLISLKDDPQQPVVCTYELNWSDPLTFREVGQLLIAPEGVNITSIMDCCHSGHDFRDFRKPLIPARFSPKRQDIVQRFLAPPQDLRSKSVSMPQRKLSVDTDILMTGCMVAQTSADAFIAGAYHGAFTYYLNQALFDLQYKTNYISLLPRTIQLLRAAGYSQTPQLEGAVKMASWPVFGVPQ